MSIPRTADAVEIAHAYDSTFFPIRRALEEINAQCTEYRERREANPGQFGNADGAWDNTHPKWGPGHVIAVWIDSLGYQYRIFWTVHKHSWALEYHYCFGKAWDSRGERTDLALGFDIRDLPQKYIGRFQLDKMRGCDRRRHATILSRACADGFDFSSISWARSGS